MIICATIVVISTSVSIIYRDTQRDTVIIGIGRDRQRDKEIQR